MNWCPQHLDKPFRLLFDTDVWKIGLLIMFFCMVAGFNQAVSLIIMFFVFFIFQKIIDRYPKGFLMHYLNIKISTGLFPKKSKYRI